MNCKQEGDSVMQIKTISDEAEKKKIARTILEALPEWFEVPESREEHIANSEGKLFFAAFEDDAPVGFLYLKQTGEKTVELAIMGVLKTFHRRGIGRKLFEAARDCAVNRGYEFMQVKTVQMGMYEDYDRTNLFYRSVGFKEFEVFPMLWDKDNPCQVYVMKLP